MTKRSLNCSHLNRRDHPNRRCHIPAHRNIPIVYPGQLCNTKHLLVHHPDFDSSSRLHPHSHENGVIDPTSADMYGHWQSHSHFRRSRTQGATMTLSGNELYRSGPLYPLKVNAYLPDSSEGPRHVRSSTGEGPRHVHWQQLRHCGLWCVTETNYL